MHTRGFDRHAFGANITYRSRRHPGKGWHGCRMLDLSESGAALEIYDMASHELLFGELSIDFEGNCGDLGFQLRGEIRDTGPGPYGGTRVGVEFGVLTPAERATLNRALDSRPV